MDEFISQSFGNAGDRAGVCNCLANKKSQALTCSGRTYSLILNLSTLSLLHTALRWMKSSSVNLDADLDS